MKLREYFNKKVIILFTDGTQTTGFVDTYTPAIDTENELFDEIGIIDSPDYPWFLGVSEEEIKEIKIIN